MKINIGSTNRAKVEALKEIIEDYPLLRGAEVFAVEVLSGVSDQPKSIDETVAGAINRARKVFSDCLYSVGLESGLMAVPGTKTGFMDVCVCAIYDGKECHLGLSSAWEAPKAVTNYMLNEGLDMTQAALKAGLTDNPQVGKAEGLVGIMTKGRLTRKSYTQEAIRTALIHLDN
ncbi:MAG: Non-canonical purine NTP phosphatase [bacterium ADurb.Bin400]|nr:MAG: Non-canonical purine NTP phosphatase [bacterium ADurb.Bin400]